MAPTPTQIATWQNDCTRTEPYQDCLGGRAEEQITDFNAMLAKNNLQELNVAPSKLTDQSCSFKAGSN